MNLNRQDSILFYPPTLVGYVRLGLLAGAVTVALVAASLEGADWWLRWLVVGLVGGNSLLDILDGHLARKLDQTTQFGTLLDLVLDLLGHTVIWVVSGFPGALALLGLEWVTGLYLAAFSMRPGRHWKISLVERAPGLIQSYFANNQRNPLSFYANISHLLFPMAWYLEISIAWVYYLLGVGLLLYELVTLYLLYSLLKILARPGA